MSWLTESVLGDQPHDRVFEFTCTACGYFWIETVEDILQRAPHDKLRLSRVAALLKCKAHGCRNVGVTLALTRADDTSGFVGGMP